MNSRLPFPWNEDYDLHLALLDFSPSENWTFSWAHEFTFFKMVVATHISLCSILHLQRRVRNFSTFHSLCIGRELQISILMAYRVELEIFPSTTVAGVPRENGECHELKNFEIRWGSERRRETCQRMGNYQYVILLSQSIFLFYFTNRINHLKKNKKNYQLVLIEVL